MQSVGQGALEYRSIESISSNGLPKYKRGKNEPEVCKTGSLIVHIKHAVDSFSIFSKH